MALLSRDRIVDDGHSLQGTRGRTLPTVSVVVAILELGVGLVLLFSGSTRAIFNLLIGLSAATMAAASGLTAIVDSSGVCPAGRLRRIPWTKIEAVSRPDKYEGSVVVVLDGRRRVQTGFPEDVLARVAGFGGKGNLES